MYMKKNQIIFVVILAGVLFLLTFIITIFSIFRIQKFEFSNLVYEDKLMESGIVEELKERVEKKFKGHSSVFFGVKEIEQVVKELSSNNKNYLIVEKVEKLSPKEVRITIGQRQIDNYCYQENNTYYHFNTHGEVLQISNTQENQLLSIPNLLVNDAVKLMTKNLKVGQAIVGMNTAEKNNLNSLKMILQSLDAYFAQKKQYRTCQYIKKVVKDESVPDIYTSNVISFNFNIENDFHYVVGENSYEIYFTKVTEHTAEKVEAMANKLNLREKEAKHNRLFITFNGTTNVANADWTNK